MTVIGIQRDERFSPNSVEKDLAILRAVMEPLGGTIIPESQLCVGGLALSELTDTVIFSMARSLGALGILQAAERCGVKVVNSPMGVAQCQRSWLVPTMHALGIPQPPKPTPQELLCGREGYWLKRGDAAAQSKDDVLFFQDGEALNEVGVRRFLARGITDYVVQTHVKGDLVKFYGVLGTGFFRTFYPSDDGQSKFGDELRNGRAHHYAYDSAVLQHTVEQLAEAINVPIYGGDAIVREDGSFVIIDFNDWPSFSRCREEAAEKIKALKN